MSATLLIVEDHPAIRETLADLILEALPQSKVLQVGNVTTAQDVLKNGSDVDLVILDLSLPDAQGLMALVDVRIVEPSAKILIVSGHDHDRTIELAFMLGANGFLSKSNTCDTIIDAVVTLAKGQKVKTAKPTTNGNGYDGLMLPHTAQIKLTKQETRILSMLCKGHMNKILAFETGLTESTVKAHISSILRKFDVPSRTQAILEIIDPFNENRS